MNRYLLFPALCAILSGSAFAQSQPQFRIKTYQKEVLGFAVPFVWHTLDSSVFHYSSDRPGTIGWKWAQERVYGVPDIYLNTCKGVNYDSVHSFAWHPIPGSAPSHRRYTQQIDGAGNVVKHTACFINATTGQPTNDYQTQNYTYNGNQLITEEKDSMVNDYSYTNGVLDEVKRYWLGDPQGSTITFIKYTYNNGLLVKETIASGQAQPNTVHYDYDMNNRVVKKVDISWNGYIYKQDTFAIYRYTYDPAGNISREETWKRPTIYWGTSVPEYQDHFFDASNRKTATIVSWPNGSGIDTGYKTSFHYNSYGMLDSMIYKEWKGVSWDTVHDSVAFKTVGHKAYFTYELYWPAKIENLAGENNDMHIYPSPASDFIRIEKDWKTAVPFSVAITDMQGRVVRRWEEPAATSYRRTVPLGGFAPGMYIMKINSGSVQAAKQFVVYK